MTVPDIVHTTVRATAARGLPSPVQDHDLSVRHTDPTRRLAGTFRCPLKRIVECTLTILGLSAICSARRTSCRRTVLSTSLVDAFPAVVHEYWRVAREHIVRVGLSRPARRVTYVVIGVDLAFLVLPTPPDPKRIIVDGNGDGNRTDNRARRRPQPPPVDARRSPLRCSP